MRFRWSQSIFLAFGETDMRALSIAKSHAKFTVERAENSDATLLSDTIQKGSAYQVLLAKFRRVLRILAVRRSTEIKIRRVAFIRKARVEA